MKNTCDQGIGGAFIKPSPRPSIHKYRGPTFYNTEVMGKSGIVKNQRQDGASNSTGEDEVDQSIEYGADVVDNSFSKTAQPISLFSFKARDIRRKSLTNEVNSEDSNILSKSLPTTLPSYFSDDSDEYPTRDDSYSTSHGTQVSSPSINRESPSNHSARYISSQNAQNWEIAYEQGKSKSGSFVKILILFFIALSAIFLTEYHTAKRVIYNESRFNNDIENLGCRYNIDYDTVIRMQTGIATIFKRQDTGSFMFVYNSHHRDFNSKILNNFVNDVSAIASKYLRNDSTPVRHTIVEGTQLDMDEHYELIGRYREDLARTGVMLVNHVEAVPSALAMAFHYYCDEYHPLVKKSAIFFTLDLMKCEETDDKLTHGVIENCLAHKWNSIAPDSIGPLLTRVVNVVIDVTSIFRQD